MSVLIRSCPTCGQANPAVSIFCPNCGLSLATVNPVSVPSTTEDAFFDVPAFLRDAGRRKRRRRDPVGGAGWSWIGAILIAIPVIFTIEPPISYAMWAGGILLAIIGFWHLRHDPSQMAKAGLLTNAVAVVALSAIGVRLFDPPNKDGGAANAIATATAAATAVPDWAENTAGSPVRTAGQGTVAMFRGDPAHTGRHPGPGPTGDPKIEWRVHTGGELYSTAAVSDGVIYIGTKTGSLLAIDEATGEDRWEYDLNDYVIVRSSPAIADGTVFIGGGYALYAVAADTGALLWQFGMPHIGQTSPTVSGGVVYVSSQEGHLYAIDMATHEATWHFQIDGLIFSSPAVGEGMVFIGSDDGNLYAVKADSGKIAWKFQTEGGIFAAPTVVNGTVYVASKSQSIFAIDVKTGEERWQYGIGGESSPAVIDGVVYVGSDDGGLYALDAKTGDPLWLVPTGSPVTSSPVVAGDTVYVASGASVYAVDTKTSDRRWNYATSDDIDSSPTVVDGLVLIGSRDGFLYAIGGDGDTDVDSPPSPGGGADSAR
ncbi:MAG: PQQ-binding-like beta-propeller repeat protein [Thermomicrobiales bacterium]